MHHSYGYTILEATFSFDGELWATWVKKLTVSIMHKHKDKPTTGIGSSSRFIVRVVWPYHTTPWSGLASNYLIRALLFIASVNNDEN